ncbi:MAG TPA: EAL domain-containing protein [Candidatus Limnocylindrales bacterium]|nr:EAL domain-containing protein [Candidatus Limnocylindrales bacterium]
MERQSSPPGPRTFADTANDIARGIVAGLRAALTPATRAGQPTARSLSDAVVETVGALVMVTDPEGRIERFNRACQALTGWSFEEMKGRQWWQVLSPPEQRERDRIGFGAAVAGLTGDAYENHWLTRTGERRLIRWSDTTIRGRDGRVQHVIGTGIDITDRRRAEDAIAAIEEVGDVLAAAGPTDGAMDAVVACIAERFGYRLVSIYMLEGEWLVLRAQRGYEASIERFPLGRGVVGRVVASRTTALVSDVTADPDYIAADATVRSEICVPFLADGTVLGVLNVESAMDQRRLDRGDVSFLESVADRLASALVIARGRQALADQVEALRTSEEQIRRIIDTASYAYIGIDADEVVTDWNQAATATFGWERDEALGRRLSETILPMEYREAHREGVRRFLATGDGPVLNRRIEVEAIHRDGRRFPVELTAWAVRSGDAYRFSALVHDISARKRLEEELRHQAFHDSLTGLANRGLFLDRVEHALATLSRSDDEVAVLFLDLDDFKTINDSLGHAAGDELLKAVAARLGESLRSSDTVARLGGDEFAVMLVGATARTEAERTARRLLGILRNPFAVAGRSVVMSASIGIALADRPGTRAADLLRDADAAMYRAKSRGKGSHVLFEQAMHTEAMARLDLEAQLRHALAENAFSLDYQPIFDLGSGAVVGYEALLRWRHAERGTIPPAEFIPLAEQTGLVVPIGRWVVRTACREAASWSRLRAHAPGLPELGIAINLSARQLSEPALVEEILAELRAARVAPERLTVELTESAMMADRATTVAALERLRGAGVKVALDDFGTGYSSLSYLQQLPIDVLKIDRSFVAGVADGGTESAVARTLLQLGQALDMQVVAEGIESEVQLAVLKRLGCTFAQGYLLGRPMTARAVRAALRGAGKEARAAQPDPAPRLRVVS